MDRGDDLSERLARGEYEVDPHLVAEAMLRKQGVGLLMLVPAEFDLGAVRPEQGEPDPGFSAA